MKQLLILTVLLFGLGPNAFSQEKTNREIKGDKYFFVYSFDRAIGFYERVDVLTTMGQRRLAESHANLGHNDEAEASYALLIVNNEGVLAEDYFAYAMLLKTDGKYDESNRLMDQFVTKKPGDLRAKSYTENKAKFSDYQMVDDSYKITEQTMNTPSQDFGTAYYADKIVYASSDVPPKMIKRKYNWNGQPYLKLYVAEVKNGQLEKRAFFDKEFNSKMHDGPASFSNNGTFMAMTTNNASDKSPDKIVELQIFTSSYNDNKWSEPVPFIHNNLGYSVGHPYLLADGNTMYFVSDMPGGFGGTDLYKTTKIGNGAWSTPENLGDKINTESDELFPFIDETNQILWFASSGHFGLGGLDIFKSTMNGASFGTVENPGAPVNTRYDDFALITNEKTHTGYLSSNRADGGGLDDIYAFESAATVQQKEFFGITKDINGNYIPGAFITLLDENGEVQDTQTADAMGHYSFKVAPDKTYELIGNKNLYIEGRTSTNSFGDEAKIEADIVLLQDKIAEPEEVIVADTDVVVNKDLAKTVKLKPIYFDYDRWNIRPDAASELDKIIVVMNKYPNMEVELMAYTDCIGTTSYNNELSQKRANSTIEYIRSRISKPTRITGKGVGETKPVNACACEDGVVSDCSETEHQKNRRSEFIVRK
jgi:outer membrane protein OmpA-like peptidoglycan-associated protein